MVYSAGESPKKEIAGAGSFDEWQVLAVFVLIFEKNCLKKWAAILGSQNPTLISNKLSLIKKQVTFAHIKNQGIEIQLHRNLRRGRRAGIGS